MRRTPTSFARATFVSRTQKWLLRRSIVFTWLLAFFLCDSVVMAQDRPAKRVWIEQFRGSQAEILREAVARALIRDESIELIPQAAVAATTERVGERESAETTRLLIARELRADAIVGGTITLVRGEYTIEIIVRNGADGETLSETQWNDRRASALATKIEQELTDQLFAVFEASSAAPWQAPNTVPTGESGQSPGARPAAGQAVTSGTPPAVTVQALERALELQLGFEILRRDFVYNDDIFGALRGYRLPVGGAFSGKVALYPGGFSSSELASCFGLEVEFGNGLVLSSKSDTNKSFPTNFSRYQVSATARVPWDIFRFRVEVGYGEHVFEIDPAGPGQPRPDVPDTDYAFVVLGGGVDARLTPDISAWIAANYLHLVRANELLTEHYFPYGKGGGVDLNIGLNYRVWHALGVAAEFRWRRFLFDMQSSPGDRYVAGGATEDYLSAWFGMTWGL